MEYSNDEWVRMVKLVDSKFQSTDLAQTASRIMMSLSQINTEYGVVREIWISSFDVSE